MTPSNPGPNSSNGDSMSDTTLNGSPKQKVDEDARYAKEEVGDEARKKAEAGQHRVADEADVLSDAIDAAASKLDNQDREGLARYARELSSNLANAAGQLEGRSVDELANDAKRLARENPSLYMLSSIAVGFGLSRFFKASTERDNHEDDKSYRSDDALRDDNASSGTPVQPRASGKTETYTTSTAPGSSHGRELL